MAQAVLSRSTVVEVATEASLLAVRSTVRGAAADVGLGIVAQTKLVTAASELARNILRYAERGTMTASRTEMDGRVGVRVVFADTGPGIADLDLAMTDGYSTGDGLGMGLPGAKRLVDEFVLQSTPQGTTVEVCCWAA